MIVKCGGWIAVAVSAGALAAPSGVQGATFEVNRTADTPPNGCANQGCTLREAVIAANNRAGADTIVLRSGRTYRLQIAGPLEGDAGTGDLDLHGPTTVRSSARKPATVDADGLDRIFDASARTTLRGLRMIGGVTQMVAGEEEGGAIRSAGGRILLFRCSLNGIEAPPLGLGAANAAVQKREGFGGDIVLERTKVRDTNGVAALTRGTGDIVVERSRLLDSFYGALVSFGDGGIHVLRSVVAGGERGALRDFEGGGIALVRSRLADFTQSGLTDFDAGAIVVNRSQITGSGDDAATDFSGGGIRVQRSRIAQNGEGITDFDAGAIVVARSRISGTDGDAVGDFGLGAIRVLDSVLANNTGTAAGDFDEGGVTVAGSRITDSGSQGVSDFGAGGVKVLDTRVLRSGSQGVQDFDEGRVSLVRSAVVTSGSQGVQNFGPGTLALRRARVENTVLEAVAQFDAGPLRISHSTVAGSQRTGVFVGSAALSSRIVSSTISGNRTTSDGGGIENLGPLTIRNSTIAGNRADGSGGGITNSGSDADLTLNNVTVAYNIADADESLAGSGGGLYSDATGQFAVGNSIIARNDQLTGDADDCAGLFDSAGGNLRTTTADCGGFDGAGDIVRGNPRLGQLRRNGGPTKTISLKGASPAIGLARKASAEARDQRGRKRDADPDSGAFER